MERGHLVVERHKDEAVLIGDNVKVTVVKTGASTKLLIEAPKEVKVLRAELERKAA